MVGNSVPTIRALIPLIPLSTGALNWRRGWRLGLAKGCAPQFLILLTLFQFCVVFFIYFSFASVVLPHLSSWLLSTAAVPPHIHAMLLCQLLCSSACIIISLPLNESHIVIRDGNKFPRIPASKLTTMILSNFQISVLDRGVNWQLVMSATTMIFCGLVWLHTCPNLRNWWPWPSSSSSFWPVNCLHVLCYVLLRPLADDLNPQC